MEDGDAVLSASARLRPGIGALSSRAFFTVPETQRTF